MAYCVRCKSKKQMQGAHPVVLKNRRGATKGTCPTCRGTIYRIEKYHPRTW